MDRKKWFFSLKELFFSCLMIQGGYVNLNNNYWKSNCGSVYGVGELMSKSDAIP